VTGVASFFEKLPLALPKKIQRKARPFYFFTWLNLEKSWLKIEGMRPKNAFFVK
jgi:hypothetical protein